MGRAVVHFEIAGQDAPTLMAFYTKMFGWKVDAANPMQYGVVDTKSTGVNGGICGAMPGGPERWVTIYMGVDSIDQTLAKIEKAGGKTVTPRTVIPGMVTFAQFSDPAGNLVGLVENAMPSAEPAATKKKTAKKKTAKKKTAKKKTGQASATKAPAKKKAAKKKAAKKKR